MPHVSLPAVMDRLTLTNVAIVVVLYYVCVVVYRLFLHPLARFPGPRLAAISRWYEAYYDVIQEGQYTFKIAKLHKKYGPIIRISPHELHVSDSSFYATLYRQDGRWDKYDWPYRAFGAPHSSFCTIGHEIHKRRRGAIDPFFSTAKVRASISIVQKHVQKLSDRIEEYVTSGAVLNLGITYNALIGDIVTEYVLGKSYDSLDLEDFNQGIVEGLQGFGFIWRVSKHVPWLLPLFLSVPVQWFLEKLSSESQKNAFTAFHENFIYQTKSVLSKLQSGSDFDKSNHNTVIHQIFDSPSLPPAEKALHRVTEEVQTILGAGLETAAIPLRAITYYVYTNKETLRRLRTELAGLGSVNSQWSLRELEHLPYLTAVIMEGLRLNPGLATRLARIAPDRDLTYDKWIIPAGSPVGMTAFLMHHDEKVYPNPGAFDPERWLDEEWKRKASKSFGPFSRGTRNCLGMHLAWAVLYHTVAMVVSRFELEFAGTEAVDIECGSDQFVLGHKRNRGVKVFVKKCAK